MNALSSHGIASLRPILMDVTKDDRVEAVVGQIEQEHPEGLYAVINNAGWWR